MKKIIKKLITKIEPKDRKVGQWDWEYFFIVDQFLRLSPNNEIHIVATNGYDDDPPEIDCAEIYETRLETEDEHNQRIKEDEDRTLINNALMKNDRYNTYLKLKQEFESKPTDNATT